LENPKEIDEILAKGAAKARALASAKLIEIKKAIGAQ
jgi:hypothetical protein